MIERCERWAGFPAGTPWISAPIARHTVLQGSAKVYMVGIVLTGQRPDTSVTRPATRVDTQRPVLPSLGCPFGLKSGK